MEILERLNGFVWGAAALVLILVVGVYITVRTRFAQFALLPKAIKEFIYRFRSKGTGNGISPYQALCTALAATVGTGNLAGVAGAIAIGGPGSVFWMWVCAFLGMATKFAEATLAVHYRKKNERGEWVGGPMYMIAGGLNKRWHWFGGLYCFFGVVAAFGVGNATQINTVIGGVNSTLSFFGLEQSLWGDVLMGLGLAILLTVLLLGGAKKIGTAAEKIVPFAALLYLALGAGVLLVKFQAIPSAFAAIVQGAFAPNAVTGGVIGSMFTALRVGTSRGVFTNEAGMGTAGIAHAGAEVSHPAEQGLMGIMEVFIDTIVICTMTALVILCSGVEIPYGLDVGVTLTMDAFSAVYGRWVCIPITVALCALAIATVLGWGLYGARCAQYLFGTNVWRYFVFLQGAVVVASTFLQTGTVWILSEMVNGLMAIPNLIALAILTPTLAKLCRQYKKQARLKTTPV